MGYALVYYVGQSVQDLGICSCALLCNLSVFDLYVSLSFFLSLVIISCSNNKIEHSTTKMARNCVCLCIREESVWIGRGDVSFFVFRTIDRNK